MRTAKRCKFAGYLLGAATVTAAQAQTQPRAEVFDFGRFGHVHAFWPEGKPRSVALLAAERWDDRAAAAAQSLAAGGALVAGIDAGVYLKAASSGGDPCAYPAGEVEALAHLFERRYAVAEYLVPTLVGTGTGAALWYAALAQAPRGTFHALLTAGFCPRLPLTHALCPGSGLHSSTTIQATVLEPAPDLQVPWMALDTGAARSCPGTQMAKFVAANSPEQARAITAATGGGWDAQWSAAYLKLAAVATRVPLPEQVGDLPLNEVPAAPSGARKGHEDRFAVLFTGDGGWAGIDKDMAARLAAANIPAVGLSTLKYFWHAHTPAETARDLARIVRYYGTRWQRQRVLLIGYSFGADLLPEVVNGLPADVKRRIAALNLIGLSRNASFEIRVGGWLGQENAGSPVRPQIDKLGALPVVCIRGDDENESLCPELASKHLRQVLLPGGHHYNGDYGALVKAILNGGT